MNFLGLRRAVWSIDGLNLDENHTANPFLTLPGPEIGLPEPVMKHFRAQEKLKKSKTKSDKLLVVRLFEGGTAAAPSPRRRERARWTAVMLP